MHFFTHEACLAHDPEPATGLAPARLRSIEAALCGSGSGPGPGPGLGLVCKKTARALPRDDIELVHTREYIGRVLEPVPDGENVAFDPETFAMSGTAEAALHSAGLVVTAAREAMAGEAATSFCSVSPGGHHAEADMACGFCFFNHVALAAFTVRRDFRCRVAVLDFDAHHGNGTQNMFWNHEDLLYVSLHEDNGMTGLAEERGSHGNILNIPLAPETPPSVFRAKLEERALPEIKNFAPRLLLVSAGFDMHIEDPMSRQMLQTGDYGWVGEKLGAFAASHCEGRLVSVLEGGYNIDALSQSVACYLRGVQKGICQ